VKRRRNWVGALGLIVLLIALPLATFLQRPPDPEAPLRKAQAELAAGRPVTLVPDKGFPAWHSWPLGEAALRASPVGDGTCLISSADVTLLEVLPDPMRERLRFRAEVQHEGYLGISEVGLYFAHSAHPGPAGTDHCFCTIHFNDRRAAENNAVECLLQRYRYPDCVRRSTRLVSHPFPPAQQLEKGSRRWRQLAVVVTPERWEVLWLRDPVGSTLRDRVEQFSREDLNPAGDARCHRPDLAPPFSPRGGLGLYVKQGQAAFRNVVVEPLD
jgi:hypothetical protein